MGKEKSFNNYALDTIKTRSLFSPLYFPLLFLVNLKLYLNTKEKLFVKLCWRKEQGQLRKILMHLKLKIFTAISPQPVRHCFVHLISTNFRKNKFSSVKIR